MAAAKPQDLGALALPAHIRLIAVCLSQHQQYYGVAKTKSKKSFTCTHAP